LTHELIEDGTTTDAPAVDIDAVLTAHLRRTLGTWPPLAPLAVVSAPARDEPGWDGTIRPLTGIASPAGTVISVAERYLDAASALLEASDSEGVLARIGGLITGSETRLLRGTFRVGRTRPPLEPAGEWVSASDRRLPEWLRPFGGEVLVAFDDDGDYVAGVGRKRHDEFAHELAVSTEPAQRGRGLARRLVAQAARRIADEGRIATYLHAKDNLASAAVADAAGFPDVGWQILGLPSQT